MLFYARVVDCSDLNNNADTGIIHITPDLQKKALDRDALQKKALETIIQTRSEAKREGVD
jgi:hypothetical protein